MFDPKNPPPRREPGPEHPEVARREEYANFWPEEEPFPLTPMEAWYLLQGWAVKPAAGLSMEQYMKLPGKLEYVDGYVLLWQS